jgi:hypothetical protein
MMGKHLDSDGIERIGNQWGFNSFTTMEGAEASVRRLARKGTHWYLWRLADGTYDFTATAEPRSPGHPAELVREIDIHKSAPRRRP